MKLSDGERLLAVMLAEVMEALKLDREVDPSLIKTLVCNGDDWAIKRKYPGIFSNERDTSEAVTETTNILWMWGIIEHSLSELTGSEAEEAKGWHWTKFNGFDGNNDQHYGIALTMINELGEFESFKGRGLNSHTQSSLPRYRSMYSTFEKHLHAGAANPLSMEALRDLCN
jgi:uncharacterized protein YfbU (UPF0304 family)